MPTLDPLWLSAASVCAYMAVLFGPGLVLGVAAGIRGWALAGMAPLLSYTALGLAGPYLNQLGLPFNLVTALVATLVFTGVVLAVRLVANRTRFGGRAADPAPMALTWSRNAHLAVIACVVAAFVVSIIVVVGATGGALDAVFQRWDPVFHANGIRYITETGDGGLYGVSSVNRYGPQGSLFYPNAYHLAGALVQLMTGASIPVVLNAITMPLTGIFALSMTVLVREFGGRAMFAGGTALLAATVTYAMHESIANGLVPFALSVALTPLGAVALHRFLTMPNVGNGLVLLLGAAGLLSVHSSALFAAILLAAPLLVQRWLRRDGKPRMDLVRLAPIAIAGGLLTLPHLLGALSHANGDYTYTPWASNMPLSEALWSLGLFWHNQDNPQLLLAGLLLIGLIRFRTLGSLRWVGAAALLFGVFWVLVASYGGVDWVVAISRPWWNDRFRIIALAAIPLCLLAAHGLAETQRWLARLAASNVIRRHPQRATVAGALSAVVLLIAVGVTTKGFYATTNSVIVAHAYHKKPEDRAGLAQPITVSQAELTAMRKMAAFAEPGERVLNDRADGSVWLYAITGVKSVAAHFDDKVPPPDAQYLAEHFNDYETDPEVRAAVERLNVRHVFIGSGLWPGFGRAPGLTGLADADFLEVVYRNQDAVIYRITD
ncbi:DUF6541 family protein [Haloechinothrix halophila]|uniref:DUF6541 family protein n=1 Tax=Haloechinothrix halophila TaxID=1069073 RepID=UPI0005585993|nr:DUF6541 family protein [Haloechinothrix halophila]